MPADPGKWRWAAASRIGTSHLKAGTRKQDAYTVKIPGRDTLCAIVSDGAGSSSHGGEGASLVCRMLSTVICDWIALQGGLPSDDQIHEWLDSIRDRLALVAGKRELTKRQFASTLIALVVRGEELLALQIGDSALVARKAGRWEAICWPENGEFASTTYFVTDDPEPRLLIIRRAAGDYDAFAAFSDGIESIALHHANREPHARFFDPMIKPIDQATQRGRLAALSAALGRYLDGPAICDRTDDDKTLVLVSRG
nr:PP2C family serine/threonine-protein phosphatase [Sphingomonas panacis]